MDGIHDLGGMEGFGPVVPEEDEPVFHAEWERSVLCHVLAVSVAGYFEAGELRHAQERIPPAEYLRSSYYERWLRGLETLLVEKDIVTAAELACGASQRETGGWALPPAPAERIQFALTNRIPASLDIAVAPRFRIG